LRQVDVTVAADAQLGRVIVFHDPEQIAEHDCAVPVELGPVLERLTGELTCEQIAEQASAETSRPIETDLVVRIARDLEERMFVLGAPFHAVRARIVRAFADAPVRDATHAGRAYHRDPQKLVSYIEKECFGVASGKPGNGKLVGLIAPHIDPWRGARSYGEAYGVVKQSIAEDVDTFVIFGTSHVPMAEPFALCRKAFATPFGHVSAAHEAIDAIARACDFDPYADQYNHKQEHSLEFQIVFLRHVLGKRPLYIVPILAGLSEHLATAESPLKSRTVERFFQAVRSVVRSKRAVVVAGADFAHVGPHFGDRDALGDRERAELEKTDRESLDHALRLDAEGFFRHVAQDLATRRVCGLAPVYSLLRTVKGTARGTLAHYEQTIDPRNQSIVSHAAVAFYEMGTKQNEAEDETEIDPR